MNELGDIDQLENLLRGATNPGALAEVDIDRARELLGDDAAAQPRAHGRAGQDARGGRPHRAARRAASSSRPPGIRKIGQNALNDLFQKLARDKMGQHEIERTGVGHERAYDTKPYEFGDPFNLHIERTVRNAVAARRRRHAGARSRPTTSRSSAPSTSSGRAPC